MWTARWTNRLSASVICPDFTTFGVFNLSVYQDVLYNNNSIKTIRDIAGCIFINVTVMKTKGGGSRGRKEIISVWRMT